MRIKFVSNDEFIVAMVHDSACVSSHEVTEQPQCRAATTINTSGAGDISVSTFIVGLSCSFASFVGILVGANLGRMHDRYLALNALRRQSDDGYTSMRFEIERSNR